MRTTTESVSDVSSRGCDAPALSLPSPETTQTHNDADSNCPCVACMVACERQVNDGRIPVNGSWWKIQKRFAITPSLRVLSRICPACGMVKNPNGNCSVVTCAKHNPDLLCPLCAGAREDRRQFVDDGGTFLCHHSFHGDLPTEVLPEKTEAEEI